MSKPKLTPWFPGHIKPVRPGVYERRGWIALRYSFWNGHVWMGAADTPREACFAGWICSQQDDGWRGLAEQPK